jgi:hypothetical protein
VNLAGVRVPPGQQVQISVALNEQGQPVVVSPQPLTPTPGPSESVRPSPVIKPVRARPQLVKGNQPRPAILAENRHGTTNIGPTAMDARWSNYGEYLQRMINTVQIQWECDLLEQKANPASGSAVTVKFVMNDEGQIVEIKVEQTTASEIATRACVNAITARMPYGSWTDEMKAVLGHKQEMTFTFHYQ